MEYCNVLDEAVKQTDSILRLAYVSSFAITFLSCLEKNNTKPFNPLLGETYELITDEFELLAEQVSHHPPITAYHCKGKTGYRVWGCNRAKTKFTGRNLMFI